MHEQSDVFLLLIQCFSRDFFVTNLNKSGSIISQVFRFLCSFIVNCILIFYSYLALFYEAARIYSHIRYESDLCSLLTSIKTAYFEEISYSFLIDLQNEVFSFTPTHIGPMPSTTMGTRSRDHVSQWVEEIRRS